MNKKVCNEPILKINEDKFLLVISKGETFKTSYSMVEKNDCNGKTHWKQSFSYQFDQEFIKNNKEKLEKLGILEKVEVKEK